MFLENWIANNFVALGTGQAAKTDEFSETFISHFQFKNFGPLYRFLFGRFPKKKCKHNFPKRFKGRLESFRKFIYFGSLTLPLELGPDGILVPDPS